MKLILKIAIPMLLLNFLTLFSACIGQNAPKKINQKTVENPGPSALGKPVLKMEGGVMVVFQDQQNNYWFGGGEKGVYQYNGKTLVLYTVEDGLCSNVISGIQEDRQGNLYFDSSKGVSKFDGQKFEMLEVAEGTDHEWKLTPDDLWFRMGWGRKGPVRYDGRLLYPLAFPKTQRVDEFYAQNPNVSYSPYNVYTIYKDRSGAMWFGTGSLGLCCYDGQSIRWLYEKQLTETPSGGDFGIRSILEDQAGDFWFCNTRYRYQILPGASTIDGTPYINYKRTAGVAYLGGEGEAAFPYFMSIAEDAHGDLWMVTYDDGVWRNDGEKLIHYPVKEKGLNISLFSIYQDRQGNLWLGTHHSGVYQFDGSNFVKFIF